MVSDLVSQNINIFLRNTVKVTGVVVFMFSLSWQLSLVTFMGFPIIMMVSDVYGKYYKVGPAWSPLGSERWQLLSDPLGRFRGPPGASEGLIVGLHLRSFTGSFQSFSKYLLSTYCVPGTGMYR